jgi:hypothetical protein
MRNRLVFAAVALLLNVSIAFGQTSSDIEKEYGKPVNAYSVGEHIWMTPEYATGGQVCRMRLYPKRFSANTNYLYSDLPFNEFQTAVDYLIPSNGRGAKQEPFDSGATGGGAMWAIFKYEKVTVTYSASFKVDPDSWKELKPFVFSEETLREFSPSNSVKPEDDFLPYRNYKYEVVTVTWSGRKCAGN